MMKRAFLAAGLAALGFATSAAAQDAAQEPSIFDRDHLSVGVGVGYQSSYIGSDDYIFSPSGLVQGRFHGIDINSRTNGIALDFIPNPPDKVGFNLGVVGELRLNRSRKSHDAVVDLLPRLNKAIEFGPTVGVSIPHVLDPYDSLSFGIDAVWDVTNAYKGMAINPHASYQTPLSPAILASVSVNAWYGDDRFADYYWSVTPGASAITGLPTYRARHGFNQVGSTLFLGYDLDGDLRNGGAALFAAAGYTRLLGDAKRSPFTSLRGSADQFYLAAGVGYTF
jgi:outer membrane scaffolding protein for murein synthesis (MipA/OmpV family)